MVTGVLLPAGAIALVAVALLMPVRMALSDLQRVGAVLIVLAAISAAVLVRAGERTPQWQVATGTFAAAGAFACYRLAAHLTGGAHAVALEACTAATLIVIAASVHLTLALPDGRLTRPPVPSRGPARPERPAQPSRPRWTGVVIGYAAAGAAGVLLAVQGIAVSVPWGAALWAGGARPHPAGPAA